LSTSYPGFGNLILLLPDYSYRNVYSQVDQYFDCYEEQDTLDQLFTLGIIRIVPPLQAVEWYNPLVWRELDGYMLDLIRAFEGARMGRRVSLQRPRALDPPG